eukprot:357773-Chlamydomonas_euryale.AAC.2
MAHHICSLCRVPTCAAHLACRLQTRSFVLEGPPMHHQARQAGDKPSRALLLIVCIKSRGVNQPVAPALSSSQKTRLVPGSP